MPSVLLLEGRPRAPAPLSPPEERTAEAEDPGRVLACFRCRHAVTTTGARIAMCGAHAHTCTNPAGFVYHIGCFAAAPGCRETGEPAREFSWFPPYAWQIAVCAACGEHLGWRFRSGDSLFHGLILDRLVEVEDHRRLP